MAVVELTSKNFEKEVIKSKIPVIADFWASWCGPCRMMAPVFEKLSDHKNFKGKLKFAKLETEKERIIAGTYNILSIPCLIVFNEGEEFERIIGFYPEELLKKKIESVLKGI